jgi:hypothetical protein
MIPSRYLTPKWQAYVTPKEKSFVFSNGVGVRSLWELKQALLTLPEDVVNNHLQNENDIAVWVEFVIGDKELAEEMKSNKHRWGMIVALERQMMRTLSLPSYVAKRWLTPVENGFTFSSGEQVKSLSELKDALAKVSDEVIAFHQERMPNDISVWAMDVVGDYELADLLQEASSRLQMLRFVEDHVDMLEEASRE